jgi:hypothetical protein
VNLREGTRRLAMLLGMAGVIVGGLASYVELQAALEQRARRNRFEGLVNSDVVRQERKDQAAGWVPIDPKTGERTTDQLVNKGGIKTIRWTEENEVESIETVDGEYLFPTPAPSAGTYLLVPLLPILGFLIPWGAIRAIGWVGVGFTQSPK